MKVFIAILYSVSAISLILKSSSSIAVASRNAFALPANDSTTRTSKLSTESLDSDDRNMILTPSPSTSWMLDSLNDLRALKRLDLVSLSEPPV